MNHQKHFDLDGFDSAAPGTRRWASCYETHPVLKLLNGKVWGGSCMSPVTNEADIYIGFQSGMHVIDFDLDMPKVHIQHTISDMCAPKNAAKFRRLVDWSALQLEAGRSIHAGCIGGHGRTGTYLAALVSVVLGEKDAITWVRKHYCEKAVESASQVRFLHQEFGITQVSGHKESYGHKVKSYSAPSASSNGNPLGYTKSSPPKADVASVAFKGASRVWNKIAGGQSPLVISAMVAENHLTNSAELG